ncbi:MAG: YfbK domain-containing protein, partial [Halieaceae bacterium]|nr:YfbK domain-containing protein [Halieaceae bacterium]
LGFGYGNLKDNKMETLADKGNGVYYYIDSELEARKVFVEELGGTLVTVAKDVKLQIEFNPLTVKGYRLIGYENRLLNYEDFDDDTKDAGDMGAGHEVIAFYEIIPASSDEVVDTEEFEQPEELKYDGTNHPDELMTLSLRYKDPESSTSQLIEHITYVTDKTDTPSEAFRFASSVVEFSLVLRDSQFQGGASFTSVIDRASNALGTDEQGYRAQFIELVQAAMQLYSDLED